jgi:hypothetical protein
MNILDPIIRALQMAVPVRRKGDILENGFNDFDQISVVYEDPSCKPRCAVISTKHFQEGTYSI